MSRAVCTDSYGSTTTHTWDYKNRLTRTVGNSATTTYGYDHTGQRVWMTTNGTATTTYINKWYDIFATKSGATTTATTSTSLFAGDTLVGSITTTSTNGAATTTPTISYIHTDHLNSTNVVTNASGTPTYTLDYLPYGERRVNTGTDTAQREYIGERYDESSRLNYLNARYHDGVRGQFLSQDPLVIDMGKREGSIRKLLLEPQRQNMYSYAGNNPLRYLDTNGKDYLEFKFGGMLPVYGILGISGTLGLRLDNVGVDVFYAAGPSIGAGVNIGASWVPKQNLSHKPDITISNEFEMVPVVGMTIGREGEFDDENPKNIWKNPKNTTSLNIGLSAGVSSEISKSRPIYMFNTHTQSGRQSNLPNAVIQGNDIYVRNSSGLLNYYGSISNEGIDKNNSKK